MSTTWVMLDGARWSWMAVNRTRWLTRVATTWAVATITTHLRVPSQRSTGAWNTSKRTAYMTRDAGFAIQKALLIRARIGCLTSSWILLLLRWSRTCSTGSGAITTITLVMAMTSSQTWVPGEERIQDRTGLDGSGSARAIMHR